MYLPRSFEEQDSATLDAFIRAHPLATLVTLRGSELCADHIPLLLCREAERTVLRGHVARANPVWQSVESNADVLVVFHEAGGYISPSWYATKSATGRVVPTWNYTAVHVTGKACTHHDSDWLRAFLELLTETFERPRPEPWKLSDAPGDYIDAQLRAIVGIEIDVARCIGKWKMSQNRSPADVAGVVDGLRRCDDPAARAMADEIERQRPR